MTHDALERTALALEHSVWRAVVEKDGDSLAKLFADDYVEVTLDGKRVAKGETVTESPKIDEIVAYTIESARVVSITDACLLLSYHLTIDGTSRGIEITPRDRWATSIWRLLDSNWQCILFQQSTFGKDHCTDDG